MTTPTVKLSRKEVKEIIRTMGISVIPTHGFEKSVTPNVTFPDFIITKPQWQILYNVMQSFKDCETSRNTRADITLEIHLTVPHGFVAHVMCGSEILRSFFIGDKIISYETVKDVIAVGNIVISDTLTYGTIKSFNNDDVDIEWTFASGIPNRVNYSIHQLRGFTVQFRSESV